MNNIVKDFLLVRIGINNITWNLLTVNNISVDNQELLNLLACSFIGKNEKNKLFQSLIKKKLPITLTNELNNFFQDHYRNLLKQYPFKDDLVREFIINILDWIIIVDQEISIKNINKILIYISTINLNFWIILIKELYDRKLYDFCLIIIGKKKPKFKKSQLYEDLILYEIFTIKELYDYLNNRILIKKINTLSSEIKHYPVSKFFIQLECSLLNENIIKFNKIFDENISLLNNLSIFDLLYIFEFSVLIKSEKAYNILNKRILTFDIIEKENKYEYSLYSFYKNIYNGNINNALNFVHRLAEEKYNFNHVIWFIKKNIDVDSSRLLYVIQNKINAFY